MTHCIAFSDLYCIQPMKLECIRKSGRASNKAGLALPCGVAKTLTGWNNKQVNTHN